jgi:hypothetical protein
MEAKSVAWTEVVSARLAWQRALTTWEGQRDLAAANRSNHPNLGHEEHEARQAEAYAHLAERTRLLRVAMWSYRRASTDSVNQPRFPPDVEVSRWSA